MPELSRQCKRGQTPNGGARTVARARMSLGKDRTSSAAKTTSLTRPWVPEISGYVLSLRRRAAWRHHQRYTGGVALHQRAEERLDGQLSPVESGQPLRDNFKATTVNPSKRSQVQVPHENIGADTNPSFTADACRSRLKRESAPQKSSTLHGGGQ